MTAAIPEGFNTITPYLLVDGAAKAIDLYKKAFGATEIRRMPDPKTGRIMHVALQIGSSHVFLSDTNPEANCAAPTTSSFYLYLPDVDAAFRQAKAAGMEQLSAPEDMFWGDRMGNVKDPFGNVWTLATHVRDVSPQEMAEAMKKMPSKAA